MHSMNHPPPSVNCPHPGLALVPHDRLPRLRVRYVDLLQTLSASPVTVYFRGVITQIDALLEPDQEAV
jgi:hypothetical protein